MWRRLCDLVFTCCCGGCILCMQVSKLYGYALCVCGWICVYRVCVFICEVYNCIWVQLCTHLWLFSWNKFLMLSCWVKVDKCLVWSWWASGRKFVSHQSVPCNPGSCTCTHTMGRCVLSFANLIGKGLCFSDNTSQWCARVCEATEKNGHIFVQLEFF